jgi:hypothetical protein
MVPGPEQRRRDWVYLCRARAIEKVVLNPERFPVTAGGCRYCTLKTYPFRIVFRHQSSRITIIAIAHAKRRPSYWRGRV